MTAWRKRNGVWESDAGASFEEQDEDARKYRSAAYDARNAGKLDRARSTYSYDKRKPGRVQARRSSYKAKRVKQYDRRVSKQYRYSKPARRSWPQSISDGFKTIFGG